MMRLQHASRWLRQLGRRLPRGSQGLTVLWLDGQWLKLLHASGSWHARTMTTLLAHPVAGMSEEEVLAWLTQQCQADAFDPGSVLVANPTYLTTARLFTLPATDPAEIRDIVELQVEKHTPYAKDEILTDFTILDTDPSGYSRVMLIISHQDIVHRTLKLVDALGWPLEQVGFELEGLINWFRRLRGGAPQETTLLAELDDQTTTLAILKTSRPYFHRSVPFGASQFLAEPTEAQNRFVSELRRSLDAFEAEGLNLPVTDVVLTGQAERFPALADHIRQALELPTEIVSTFEGFRLTEAAAAQTSNVPVSFASLLGLALAPSEVDLTPQALKLHQTFEVRARMLVGLGCQVIAALVLVSCLIIGNAYKSERYYRRLLAEHQRTAQEVRELEGTLAQVKLVETWLRAQGQLLGTMTDLNRLSPETLQWESLVFRQDEQVILKGVCEEMPQVFEFVASLKQSPLFSQVEAQRVTKRREGERDVTDFEIVCPLAMPGGSDAYTASAGG